ncbi:MAG: hypothetical protein LBI34_00610 [Puniceicoccales bacterium]|nr:hypothetical protein [Puniceicoccales bacterium]
MPTSTNYVVVFFDKLGQLNEQAVTRVHRIVSHALEAQRLYLFAFNKGELSRLVLALTAAYCANPQLNGTSIALLVNIFVRFSGPDADLSRQVGDNRCVYECRGNDFANEYFVLLRQMVEESGPWHVREDRGNNEVQLLSPGGIANVMELLSILDATPEARNFAIERKVVSRLRQLADMFRVAWSCSVQGDNPQGGERAALYMRLTAWFDHLSNFNPGCAPEFRAAEENGQFIIFENVSRPADLGNSAMLLAPMPLEEWQIRFRQMCMSDAIRCFFPHNSPGNEVLATKFSEDIDSRLHECLSLCTGYFYPMKLDSQRLRNGVLRENWTCKCFFIEFSSELNRLFRGQQAAPNQTPAQDMYPVVRSPREEMFTDLRNGPFASAEARSALFDDSGASLPAPASALVNEPIIWHMAQPTSDDMDLRLSDVATGDILPIPTSMLDITHLSPNTVPRRAPQGMNLTGAVRMVSLPHPLNEQHMREAMARSALVEDAAAMLAPASALANEPRTQRMDPPAADIAVGPAGPAGLTRLAGLDRAVFANPINNQLAMEAIARAFFAADRAAPHAMTQAMEPFGGTLATNPPGFGPPTQTAGPIDHWREAVHTNFNEIIQLIVDLDQQHRGDMQQARLILAMISAMSPEQIRRQFEERHFEDYHVQLQRI